MGNARIQIRRGTVAFWESENPILHSGEPGFERDTNKFKIGDGITPWNALLYMGTLGTQGPSGPEGPQGEPGLPGPSSSLEELNVHINDVTPHPVYDDGPSLYLLYQNAKV